MCDISEIECKSRYENPAGFSKPDLKEIFKNIKQSYSSSYFFSFGNTVLFHLKYYLCYPDSSVGKESACNAGDPGAIPGSGRYTGKGIGHPLQYSWASLVAPLVKNLPAKQAM